MSIKASIAHGALTLPQYAVLLGVVYVLPLHWAVAVLCSVMWAVRELAQSFRPKAPLSINLTPQSLIDWSIPTAVAFAIALAVEVV
jgi:hypothetical protein